MVRTELLFLAWIFVACAEAPSFDSTAHLKGRIAENLGGSTAPTADLPFELEPAILAELESKLDARGDERRRARRIVELILDDLGLEYSTYPTLTASETYHSRSGNCLSFVNLFVGLARHVGLAPIYVEVIDRRGWSHREGMVVSHGHIVAGLWIDGELELFDFLPYRPRVYRRLEPLEDLRAVAHFYNNLGAEALLGGRLGKASEHLELVRRIDPNFATGLNNLGVALVRQGNRDQAAQIYRRGLELQPSNVPLLSNAARLAKLQGRAREAEDLLERLRQTRLESPYFYLTLGEQALARDQPAQALDNMREALRRGSELPEVHLGLVKTYLGLGDLRKARHHLARASKLDSTHPEIRDYERLLEGVGR